MEHTRASEPIRSLLWAIGRVGGRPPDKSSGEKPLLRCEVGRPLEAVRARKAEVGAECVSHCVHEALGAPRREAVLPPDADHLRAVPVDSRLDPADEAVAEEDG